MRAAFQLSTRTRTTLLNQIPRFHVVKKSNVTTFPLAEAVRSVKALARANFDETVEIAVNTNLDPRKNDQSIRAKCTLPHGTGQNVIVAVFAKGAKAEEAKEAGADIVGQEDLVEMITSGKVNFNRCLATPDMMPLVSKVARILGPRGMMPNPKQGSVTMAIANAVEGAKKGDVSIKTERKGVIHGAVGKVSFEQDELEDNIIAFVKAVNENKPSGSKGKLVISSFISSTHGPGIRLDMNAPEFK